jgi:hypothetical protein
MRYLKTSAERTTIFRCNFSDYKIREDCHGAPIFIEVEIVFISIPD